MTVRTTTILALLRGINVGGKNMLPMSTLEALFEALGCTDVRTYIQTETSSSEREAISKQWV
jgi:uncharacterized protein (DUF1697 family)